MPRKIRPIRVEDQLAYVTLTRGYEAVIDATDIPLVEGWNWTATVRLCTVYAYRQDCSGVKKRNIRMHRAIMGHPVGLEVDHIDGDGLNNRRRNLRAATTAQNRHNHRMRRNNTSGVKGVYWNKNAGKWHAQITLDSISRHLGYFTTQKAAAAAYAIASAELHGEFGRIA